jgi:ABC-type transporter MlaC component
MKHKVRISRLMVLVAMTLVSSVALSAPPPSSGAVKAVAKLYRDYAWEAVIEEPSSSELELFQQSRNVLEQYFDRNLATLILRDRRCSETTHEICRLDFMPMWSSQDPEAIGLKVLPTSDPSVVSVEFIYPGNSIHIKLSYYLSKTADGWRISDIRGSTDGSNWSLLSILESK